MSGETRESVGPLGLHVKTSHLSEGRCPRCNILTDPHYETSFSNEHTDCRRKRYVLVRRPNGNDVTKQNPGRTWQRYSKNLQVPQVGTVLNEQNRINRQTSRRAVHNERASSYLRCNLAT